MQGSFSIEQYVAYLAAHRRLLAAAGLTALVVAAVVTYLLPKRYTASARVVIESAAGGDFRNPQTVSPQYIELLKSYEQFASSDSLFMAALEEFQLRADSPSRTVEDWKRATLEVGMVDSTKVLEIAVTLTDPAKAQAMAEFIARRTVDLTRDVNREADEELIGEALARSEHARKEFEKADQEWSSAVADQPVEDLMARVDALELRQAAVERGAVDPSATGARRAELEQQRTQVEEELAAASRQLARRLAARQQASELRDLMRIQFEDAQRQLNSVRGTAGYRGERLQVIDPGVVPERPSSPNLMLNLIAAVLFALVGSVALLTLRFAIYSPSPS